MRSWTGRLIDVRNNQAVEIKKLKSELAIAQNEAMLWREQKLRGDRELIMQTRLSDAAQALLKRSRKDNSYYWGRLNEVCVEIYKLRSVLPEEV